MHITLLNQVNEATINTLKGKSKVDRDTFEHLQM